MTHRLKQNTEQSPNSFRVCDFFDLLIFLKTAISFPCYCQFKLPIIQLLFFLEIENRTVMKLLRTVLVLIPDLLYHFHYHHCLL